MGGSTSLWTRAQVRQQVCATCKIDFAYHILKAGSGQISSKVDSMAVEALREMIGKKELEHVDMHKQLSDLGLANLFPEENWPSLLAVRVTFVV